MALTQQTAAQAGQIAAQLAVLQQALQDAQQALAAGMTIENYQALGAVAGGPSAGFSCSFVFSTADSATIFNTLITIFQANIAALTAQLAAM